MGKAFLYGSGGGGGGVYKIKTYATEAALLADSPVDNTVGVVTATAIGSWQYATLAPTTRADGTPLAEGDIWINYVSADSTEANVLKGKNGMWVKQSACNQYLSGAWSGVLALTRKNGAWANWRTCIYDTGDECTGLTEGWNVTGYGINQYTTQLPSATKNASSFTIAAPGNQYQGLGTVSAFRISGYSTAKVNVSVTTTNAYSLLFAQVRTSKAEASAMVAQYTHTGILPTGTQTWTIDTSSLSGDYYFVVYGYDCTFSVNSIWFE